VSSESVGARETAPATPLVPVLEYATADKLFLASVKTLMALAVVLTGERFAADVADEWALVGVSAQV